MATISSSATPEVLIVRAPSLPDYTLSTKNLFDTQVGAGPSGLILTLSLLQNGIAVRIIDKELTHRIGAKGAGIAVRLFLFLPPACLAERKLSPSRARWSSTSSSVCGGILRSRHCPPRRSAYTRRRKGDSLLRRGINPNMPHRRQLIPS